MKVPVYSIEGQQLREIEMPESIFNAEINEDLIYRSVVVYLTNQRQGTASCRTRTMTSGSTRKPFRQKHTGRARAGSGKSPLWIGGGKTFGPHPRDYSKKLPKKMRQLALFSALSMKLRDNKIKVVEEFSLNEPKTRQIASILKNLMVNESACLLVTRNSEPNTLKSCRNIPSLHLMQANLINTYQLLKSDHLLLTTGSIEVLQEVYDHGA